MTVPPSRFEQGGAYAREGDYLIWRRPEARGLVGIGLLVIGFALGGQQALQHQTSPILKAAHHFPTIQVNRTDGTSEAANGLHRELVAITNDDVELEALDAIDAPAEPPPAPATPKRTERYEVVSAGGVISGIVTHYGVQYNGRPLGCGYGPYASHDTSIIAVGPTHYRQWPCGTMLEVCGPAGCLVGMRKDSCPGCGRGHLDLSESGIAVVCGQAASLCRVQVKPVSLKLVALEEPSQ